MENREIERKWLVKKIPDNLEQYPCLLIEQAYLCGSPTVRVRKENDSYYLTYKGSRRDPSNTDISHSEYNLPLDSESYEHLKEKRDGILIRKRRYVIPTEGGLHIELDVFDPPLSPLVLVEVEFETEEDAESYIPPEWFGEDVSNKPDYKNSVMALGR